MRPPLTAKGESSMGCPVRAVARFMPATITFALLSGCAGVGALMSPYSETFDCKNSDHGQCIHPERAYEDAVAGVASKSDPAVTNGKDMLRGAAATSASPRRRPQAAPGAIGNYRDSVYRELRGLIEAPVTPMLKPARTVRTLILPYADRQRPDRLYMPRYVYSVVDKPVWVMGGTLIAPPDRAARAPVLTQMKETGEAANTSDTSHPALTEPHP